MPELKLEMELVPSPLWWANPRRLMAKSQWDRIRKQVYADYNHKCGICGTEGRLECHERWEYDDASFIQRLAGLIALCPSCHGIKHFGNSGLRNVEGTLGRWVDTDDYDDYYFTAGEDRPVLVGLDDGSVVHLRVHRGKMQIMNNPIEELILHFMNVNGCSREEFEEHRPQAFKEHHERSQRKDWRVDWGPYQHLIDESRVENTELTA